MSKVNDHLPSITTMDCSERSGAQGTTVIDDDTIHKKMGKC